MAPERRQRGLSGATAASVNAAPTRAPPPDDQALVSRVVAMGDHKAYETLMRRHQQRIFYLLWRFTRNRSVAEELCQETFLRAWRKLDSFAGHGSFAGWLTKLAYNEFLQNRRRRQVTGDSLDDPRTQAAAESALAVPDSTAAPDLERLLAVVSPDEQNLLILTYAAGLSATEIADMLQSSAGTVKSRIHRAKEKIRRHFHIEAGP